LQLTTTKTNFNSVINAYHSDFESIKNGFKESYPLFWLVIACLVPMIFYFGYCAAVDVVNKDQKWFMINSAVAGGGWLFLALFITHRKSKVIKNRLKDELAIESDNFIEIESAWLEKHFPNNPPSDYLNFAQKIDSMIMLRDKYNKAERSSVLRFFNKYVLPEDAKGRIMSALLALSAVIVALSIKSGVSIHTLFDQITTDSLKTLFYAYLLIVIGIFILMRMAISMIKTVYNLVVSIFESSNSSTTFSKRRAETFINILLWHYSESIPKKLEEKKIRIKVKCG
jgi:hypothetical protein